MKRRYFGLAAALLSVFITSACVLQVQVQVKGDVYIQYGWDSGVWDVNDTNPSFQYVTAENQFYLSETGTYYASYRTLYGGYYVFNYILTADVVDSTDPYGPLSTYFYIYLANSGPIISDPVYYGRDISGGSVSANPLARSVTPTPDILADRENLGAPSIVLEKKLNGYTLHLECWKLQ
jgi:hypothetical protein